MHSSFTTKLLKKSKPMNNMNTDHTQIINQSKRFRDPVEKYVQSLKQLTFATEVNVYSKELIPIYQDDDSWRHLKPTDK